MTYRGRGIHAPYNTVPDDATVRVDQAQPLLDTVHDYTTVIQYQGRPVDLTDPELPVQRPVRGPYRVEIPIIRPEIDDSIIRDSSRTLDMSICRKDPFPGSVRIHGMKPAVCVTAVDHSVGTYNGRRSDIASSDIVFPDEHPRIVGCIDAAPASPLNVSLVHRKGIVQTAPIRSRNMSVNIISITIVNRERRTGKWYVEDHQPDDQK